MRRGLFLLAFVFGTSSASAGPASSAAREAGEFVARRFGREGAEQVARQAPKVAARHGDDAARLALVARYGDDAARAALKHPGVAEPLVAAFGRPAAVALKEVSEQNARRLGMMSDDIAKTGRADELFAVVGKHGDGAMNFLWKHKVVLAGGAALAAFLADPEPYITGAKEITQVVAENAVKPLATVAAAALPWDGLAVGGLAITGVVGLVTARRRRLNTLA